MNANNKKDLVIYNRSKKPKILFISLTIPIIAIVLWGIYDALTGIVQGSMRTIYLVGGISVNMFVVINF
jgi:hypothetical protein